MVLVQLRWRNELLVITALFHRNRCLGWKTLPQRRQRRQRAVYVFLFHLARRSRPRIVERRGAFPL